MTPLKSSHPRGTYVAVCSVHIGRDLYNCLIPAGCTAPSGTSLHRIPVTRSPGELGWVVSGWLQTVKVQPGLSASTSCVIWWSKRARGNGSSRPRQGQGGSSSPCAGKEGSGSGECGKCREKRGSRGFCTVLEGGAALFREVRHAQCTELFLVWG